MTDTEIGTVVQVGDRLIYVGYTKVRQAIVVDVGKTSCEIRWYRRDIPLEGAAFQEEYMDGQQQEVFLNEFTNDIRNLGFFNMSR